MTYQLDPVQLGPVLAASGQCRRSPCRRTAAAPRGSLRHSPTGDPTGGADGIRWREQVDGKTDLPAGVHRPRRHHPDERRRQTTCHRHPAGQPVRADRTHPYPAIVNINPYNRAAIDFIDHALHVPVVSKAMRNAAARSTPPAPLSKG